MLENISEFKVVARLGVRDTTLDVSVPGSDRPVARIHRRDKLSSLVWDDDLDHDLGVYTGPNLDYRVGSINSRSAYDVDGNSVGYVNSRKTRLGSLGHIRELHQNGVGSLVGKEVGASAKVMSRRGLDFLPFAGIAIAIAKVDVQFRGDSSPGFDMVKPFGRAGTHYFSVHDTRINRLLMLCCIFAE
ncbi:hypothetical protein ABZ942_00020 [Nocardia sp. NPDC046473]|uniref:hypothetical protein n=1 Tax=Nocardia sp. NPDC046473 TaxID=3155733 RepID=UPI00340F2379